MPRPGAPVAEAGPGAGSGEASAPSFVVLVAPSRQEQQRLLAGLPDDVPVLLVRSPEQAQRVLGQPLAPSPTRPAPGASADAGPGAPVGGTPRLLAAVTGSEPLVRAAFQVRVAERSVCVGDRTVRLTPLEFGMLRVLGSEPRRVWSFEELSRAVWSTGLVGDGAQVRAVVKRLRRKLIDAEAPVVIETVRSAGFRLVDRPSPD